MRSNLEKINMKSTIRSLPWKERWGILLAEQEAAAGSAKGDKIVIYTVLTKPRSVRRVLTALT